MVGAGERPLRTCGVLQVMSHTSDHRQLVVLNYLCFGQAGLGDKYPETGPPMRGLLADRERRGLFPDLERWKPRFCFRPARRASSESTYWLLCTQR